MANEDPGNDDPSVGLMLQLRNGNEAAFDQLVERWQTPLINFFYRSLSSHEQAEDLTQMVFIRLYRAAPGYEPRAKFTTFLFQIARRLLINEFRRSQRKPLDSRDPADLHAVASEEDHILYRELEEAFEEALHKLPENQRTAILLLKQQELSYREIADIMNAHESAVKTWIFRARQFLKQELKDLV
ncbi:MAG: RNA polymerase sigma factor [Oceanipulchritudo sp.]